jgi:hypothetical protein
MQCSSSGNLYEFDKDSKPAWKKHIWSDPSTRYSLRTSTGCTVHGLFGFGSVSLFLLSKVKKNFSFISLKNNDIIEIFSLQELEVLAVSCLKIATT